MIQREWKNDYLTHKREGGIGKISYSPVCINKPNSQFPFRQ
jgi:hypothetical protein